MVEVTLEFTGEPPSCSVRASVEDRLVGWINFDVRDHPPLHLERNAKQAARRSEAQRQRRDGGVPMIWLDTMTVVEPLKRCGIATALLDEIVAKYPDRLLTNSTKLSEEGEAFIRSWLSANDLAVDAFLWRKDDLSA